MKPSSVKTLGLLLILLTLGTGCFKENPSPTANDLSPFAKKFLTLNSASSYAAAGTKNAAINQSFKGAFNSYQTFSGVTSSGSDSSSTGSDSTIVGEPWHTCASITEFDNSDGSHTIMGQVVMMDMAITKIS